MAEDGKARLKQWLETGQARLHPLTFPQRELWEASGIPPGDISNHICTFMEVQSSISFDECEVSMQRVVNRQEVLRLSILPGKTQPLQLVRAKAAPAMTFGELSGAEAEPEAMEERMRGIFEEPFDLVRGPLYRVQIIRRGPRDMVLVFAIHHAIADGWTLGIFVQDIFASYIHGLFGSGGDLPPVPLSYTDWGAAEREAWTPKKLSEHGEFWKGNLAGAPRLWEACAAPRRLERTVMFFDADVTAAARELARRADATLFSTLLAAFQIALSRWTGVPDIVVGTPVANRTKQSVRDTMGYFSGNVPIRGQVEEGRSLEESVRVTHRAAMDSFAQAMPFAELVRAVGEPQVPGRNPIYDVRFALQNHPIPDIDIPGLSVHLRMRSTGTARFDLGCEVTETGDRLEVVWLHRPARFSPSDIETLQGLFLSVLEGACRSPESRIAALAL